MYYDIIVSIVYSTRNILLKIASLLVYYWYIGLYLPKDHITVKTIVLTTQLLFFVC